MVHIKLDSIYSISSDTLNWILLEKERPHWFFQNLVSLLKAYVELKSRGSNAKEVAQLINYQKQLLERVVQVVNKVPAKDRSIIK